MLDVIAVAEIKVGRMEAFETIKPQAVLNSVLIPSNQICYPFNMDNNNLRE